LAFNGGMTNPPSSPSLEPDTARTSLYEQVWAEPVQTVARRYGISGVALAKACRKLRVPIPPRGYWAKVAAGKNRGRRPRLPAMTGWSTPTWILHPRKRPTLSVGAAEAVANEQAPEAAIGVAGILSEPHLLVERTAIVLANATLGADGVVQRGQRRCLDLRVSPASLDRALRVADAVLKALEKRGHAVELTASHREKRQQWNRPEVEFSVPSRTLVVIAGERLAMRLFEETEAVGPARPPRPRREDGFWAWSSWKAPPPLPRRPSGMLTLSLAESHDVGRKNWSDGNGKRLEEQLNSFLAALVRVADLQRQKRLAAAEEQRVRAADAASDKQRQREQEAYERNSSRLEQQLGDWREARDIRLYVADARKRLGNVGGDEGVRERWFAWALQRADHLDPLVPERRVSSDDDEEDDGSKDLRLEELEDEDERPDEFG
jgi:hypothetical protein